MGLERLTEKAIAVLDKAALSKKLTVKVLLKLIAEADGLGKHLLETVPPNTKVKKLEEVDLEMFYQ